VLVEQVGWVKGAKQPHVHRRTLRAAFARWGLGEPTPPPGPYAPSRVARGRVAAAEALELAIQVGTKGAAERLGVDKATLYLALGAGPADRPARGRPGDGGAEAGRLPPRRPRSGIRGRWTARSGSRRGRPRLLSGRRQGRSGDHAPVSGQAAHKIKGERPGGSSPGRSACPDADACGRLSGHWSGRPDPTAERCPLVSAVPG
jgi:hypothetical protein